jgi:hypothetical protein
MPTYNEHESNTPTLLSWTVVAVHCTYCNRSIRTGGFLDRFWLLERHGGHLEYVSLELVLEPGTHVSSAMTLRLLPLELQLLCMN